MSLTAGLGAACPLPPPFGRSPSPAPFHSAVADNPASEGISPDATIGSVKKFIGIYSGRLGDGPIEVQLGMVWR